MNVRARFQQRRLLYPLERVRLDLRLTITRLPGLRGRLTESDRKFLSYVTLARQMRIASRIAANVSICNKPATKARSIAV